jgi:hypothetical protein
LCYYKVNQKYLKIFGNCAGEEQLDHRVRNEEVLYRVKEDRNILHTCTVNERKVNWIGYNLRRKHIIEGQIEVTGRQGKRCNHLLEDLKERKGY